MAKTPKKTRSTAPKPNYRQFIRKARRLAEQRGRMALIIENGTTAERQNDYLQIVKSTLDLFPYYIELYPSTEEGLLFGLHILTSLSAAGLSTEEGMLLDFMETINSAQVGAPKVFGSRGRAMLISDMEYAVQAYEHNKKAVAEEATAPPKNQT